MKTKSTPKYLKFMAAVLLPDFPRRAGKRFPGLICLLILVNLFAINPSIAQIIGGLAPVNPPAGGFRIEGDLQADTPNAGEGDWVQCAGGTCSGTHILSSTGAPLDSSTTFHLTDLYNNQLDNIFSKGKVNTNPTDTVNYKWTQSKAVGKCDMNNALIHFTTGTDGHIWVIFSADRLENTGSSYMDFEFLQNTLVKNANGTFSSQGPNGGRTPSMISS
jgi:hypothetical protein